MIAANFPSSGAIRRTARLPGVPHRIGGDVRTVRLQDQQCSALMFAQRLLPLIRNNSRLTPVQCHSSRAVLIKPAGGSALMAAAGDCYANSVAIS